MQSFVNHGAYALHAFQYASFWAEAYEKIFVGKHTLTVRISDSEENVVAEKEVFFEILKGVLPKTDIPVTQWLYPNCISSLHGVEVYSDAFYKIFENYLKTYVEYGNTMIFSSRFYAAVEYYFSRINFQIVS